MQRGEIYYAELNPVMGCEFGGQQPVVIYLYRCTYRQA